MRRSCSLRREFLPATRLKRARKSFLHAGPFFETGYRACVPDRGVGEQVSAMSSSRKLSFRCREFSETKTTLQEPELLDASAPTILNASLGNVGRLVEISDFGLLFVGLVPGW